MSASNTLTTQKRFACALALVGALTVGGCGASSADQGDDQVNQTSSQENAEEDSGEPVQEVADPEDSPREELPDGFPEEVPLPAFTGAHKVGGSTDAQFWVIVFELKESTDTPVEDYGAQLADAGYEVEQTSGGADAIGPKWEITFRTAMENTLTVSVMEK